MASFFLSSLLLLFSLLSLTQSLPARQQGPHIISRAQIRPGFQVHSMHLHVYNSVYDHLMKITIDDDDFRLKMQNERIPSYKFRQTVYATQKSYTHAKTSAHPITSPPVYMPSSSEKGMQSNVSLKTRSRPQRSPKPEPSFIHDWFNLEKQTDGDVMRLKMDFTAEKLDSIQNMATESRDQIFSLRESLTKMDDAHI